MNEVFLPIPLEHSRNIFGQYDFLAKKIERAFQVSIINRDEGIKIIGPSLGTQKAEKVLNELWQLSKRGNAIQEQNVDYGIAMCMEEKEDALLTIDGDLICHTISGRPIKPKTLGQKEYVDAIRNSMIVFGMGPAGTGKTYLAIAMAITAFKNNEVERIILTRPAIEAGEKLGFLPGDLQQKVDPYLRPLFDALYEMMGAESYQRLQEEFGLSQEKIAEKVAEHFNALLLPVLPISTCYEHKGKKGSCFPCQDTDDSLSPGLSVAPSLPSR